MNTWFGILAFLTLASAVAAVSLRQIVHCVLALIITFASLAALYLQMGAQFAGLAQLLVYVGAVAILIVFAILLTRGGAFETKSPRSWGGWCGVIIAVAVGATVAWCALHSERFQHSAPDLSPQATVRQIGENLMGEYLLPLEILGLLLTAALIGAAVITIREEAE